MQKQVSTNPNQHNISFFQRYFESVSYSDQSCPTFHIWKLHDICLCLLSMLSALHSLFTIFLCFVIYRFRHYEKGNVLRKPHKTPIYFSKKRLVSLFFCRYRYYQSAYFKKNIWELLFQQFTDSNHHNIMSLSLWGSWQSQYK